MPRVRCFPTGSWGSPIQAAAYSGHEEVVRYLLERGANANISSEGYPSPLQLATSQCHTRIVNILLESGAEIEQNDCGYPRFGSASFGTPLHCAVESGNISILQQLLNAGADPNVYSEREHRITTGLSRAVRNNNHEMVALLLDNGADVNATGEFIGGINSYSATRWHANPRGRETALQLACSLGYLDIVKLLVEKGAAVDKMGESGWCALHCSAYSAQLDVLRFLSQDTNANMSLTLPNGQTALHTLTSSFFNPEKTLDSIDVLLEAGADINLVDFLGRTVLHHSRHRAEMVQHLVKKGADVGIKDEDGNTTLDCAMREARVPKHSIGWEEVIWILEEASPPNLEVA